MGREGKGRLFSATSFSQAGSAGVASSPCPCGVPRWAQASPRCSAQPSSGSCCSLSPELCLTPLLLFSSPLSPFFLVLPVLLLIFLLLLFLLLFSSTPLLLLSSSSPLLLLSPALAPLLLPSHSPVDRTPQGGLRAPELQVVTSSAPTRALRRSPTPGPQPQPRLLLPPAPTPWPVRAVCWRPSLTDSCPCSEYNLPNSLFFRYLQICATVFNFSSTKRPFQLLPN